MAEDPKPAAKAAKKATPARKKTTRRGPTKAAALKALGLTQEDLDTLKAVAQAREVAAESDDRPAEALASDPVNRQNLAAQTGEETVPVTLDPKLAKATEFTPEPDPNAPKYIRNLRGTDVGFRLERQQGPGKKRTDLKPRGMRGDLAKLQPGDESDANLQTQIAYNVVEVIGQEEAESVIAKQSTNQQQAVHPALAMLRNPKGEEYGENSFQGVQEEQSYTVAHLDPAQMQGKVDDKTVARGNPVVRVGETQQGPIGGGPIVDFTPPNVRADEIARQKGENAPQGPAAGLAPGVQVKIAPTERT
jgi:hypothetical protein